MAFSTVYIDLYTGCRCGKVDAFEELKRMGEEGDNVAKGYTGMFLHRSTVNTIPKNQREASRLMGEIMPWLFEKDNEDDYTYDKAHVWYLLAFCYFDGIVVERDICKVVNYYELACQVGHSMAECALGNCYDWGEGVEKDLSKALSYYEKSAEQGLPVALNNCGLCYQSGDGCEASLGKAFKYIQLAAQQGFVDALYSLGNAYMFGEGVEKSRTEGFKYYLKAAELGDSDSLYEVGVCYFRGRGVGCNSKEGFKYYLSAANQKHDRASLEVAKCYGNGIGVNEDVIECVRYLHRAIKYDSGENCNAHNSITQASLRMLEEYNQSYRYRVWLNRKDFLMFLALYNFLCASDGNLLHPYADDSTHTCFYTRDLCWYISGFL